VSRAAEARALAAANGWGYKLTAKHYGVSRDHARAWLNPQRRRRVERARRRRMRPPCAWCGGPLGPVPGNAERQRQPGVCNPCRSRRRAGRDRTVQALWFAGAPMPEIAEAIGCSKNALGARMVRMRADGIDLPHRPGYPRPPRDE
jgi:transposase